MHFFKPAFLLGAALAKTAAWAEVAEPEPRADEQFDIMNELSRRGLHDLKNEDWNAYGQATFINRWKSNFPAKYTNLNGSPNSLLPGQERSFTGSATFFLGLRLWRGDWSLRFGHAAAPEHPNQLPIDTRIFKYFGQQVELERRHTLYGQPGAARLLAYRNREFMGRFDDAVAAHRANPNLNATTCPGFNYSSDNATAPDLCWARRPNIKMGIGVNLEQQLGGDVGLFFRGMYSDGDTEVYSYTSTDRSISLGALVKGARVGGEGGTPWG